MYYIIVFGNLRFRPSTRKQVANVFKKFHSGDFFRNDAFLETVFTEYVWTVGQSGEKTLRFPTKMDNTCGLGLFSKRNLPTSDPNRKKITIGKGTLQNKTKTNTTAELI